MGTSAGAVDSAGLLHYGTNDISGILTAASVVLTYETIKSVNRCTPIAAQTIELPDATTMIGAGWPPGARFSFVSGLSAFQTTIIPSAGSGDGFLGYVSTSAIILQSGLSDTVTLQLGSARDPTNWIVVDFKQIGRSEVTMTSGAIILTAASIRETVVITAGAGGQITLPAISALLAAGYQPGTDFTIVTDGAAVTTIIPTGPDTFLAGFTISRAATAAAHFATFRLPAAAGAWRCVALSAT